MTFKISRLGAMSLLLLAACAQEQAQPSAMTLETFLGSEAQARGGKEAIESIRTADIHLDITEPTFHVTGRFRATRDGFMRVDIFADGARVYTEALGPDGAWQMTADGTVSVESAEGETALRRGVYGNLYGLHELPALGYRLNFLGETRRNDGAFWEVEKIGPDGFSEHLFFDKDAYLIASEMQTAAPHPDVDSTEVRQETFHSDFRAAGGVLFANRSEKRNLDTGEVMQTIIVTARAVNVTIDPAIFARPEAAE